MKTTTADFSRRASALKHWVVPALLATAMLLAACQPATTASPTAIAPAATQPANTPAPTAPAATAQPTILPTQNRAAGATTTAVSVKEVLVQATNLIGMNLVGPNGETLGQIKDALVDESGQVKYVVVEVPGTSANKPATVVLDWSEIDAVIKDAQLTDVELQYSGTPQDLRDAMPFDIATTPDAVIINADASKLPPELNNLIRLSELQRLALEAQNQFNLGPLQDTLVDVQQGKVDYVVLDLSQVLGADASVLVPWERLTIDPQVVADAQKFGLNIDRELVLNAPIIKLSELPRFIDPTKMNWETIVNFWNSQG